MWLSLAEPRIFLIGVESCHEVRTRAPGRKGPDSVRESRKDDDLYEIILSGASGDVLKAAGSEGDGQRASVSSPAVGLNFDNDALIRLFEPHTQTATRPSSE